MSYDYWNEEDKKTKRAKWNLIHTDYTKELHEIYDRKLEIFEEILVDLAPQLEDDQYCGTTSWQYEDELKELDKRQESLEETVEKRIEEEQHQEFLKDIGMTQEEYDIHEKEVAEQRKKERAARSKRRNKNT